MITFPRAARKYVKKSLDSTFLQGLDIVPESVCYMDTKAVKVPARISNMSSLVVQEKSHPTPMPNPPQDVIEEVRVNSDYVIHVCIYLYQLKTWATKVHCLPTNFDNAINIVRLAISHSLV